nr:hypothetical protein [Tanacetum cinerariifolium]
MSDSEDSTITYTEVSSLFEGLSDIGSSGVDGLPMMPEDLYAYVVAAFQAPPLPDYVLGLKEPEQAPPLPDFIRIMRTLLIILPMEEMMTMMIDGSSDDDEDDDDDVEEDEDEDEEEEEHPALADSISPPPVHRTTARISIPVQEPTPFCPTYPLGYRVAMIWLRAETSSTSHPLPSSTPASGIQPLLAIPLPTSSPPLLLPSTSHRVDVPEDEMLVGMTGAPTTDETELGRRMVDFVTTIRQDTDEIYGRLDDAQDDRLLMSGQLNMLRRNRSAHARTAKQMESVARLSSEA